jgi:hypothetical protein
VYALVKSVPVPVPDDLAVPRLAVVVAAGLTFVVAGAGAGFFLGLSSSLRPQTKTTNETTQTETTSMQSQGATTTSPARTPPRWRWRRLRLRTQGFSPWNWNSENKKMNNKGITTNKALDAGRLTCRPPDLGLTGRPGIYSCGTAGIIFLFKKQKNREGLSS